MRAQTRAILAHMKQLLPRRFHRIDESVLTRGLDDVTSIDHLRSRGKEVASEHWQAVHDKFFVGAKVDDRRPVMSPSRH